MDPPFTLIDLPEEILARIIHFLRSGKTHCKLAQTCSHFRYHIFAHVRSLSLIKYPAPFVERILPKYPNLHTLEIFKAVPDVSALSHLTHIRRFYCAPGYLGGNLNQELREQMIPRMDAVAEWLLHQPIERLSLSWKYLSMEAIEKVVQIPTLRIIDNIIPAEVTPFITSNLEYLSLSLRRNEVPTLGHMRKLRQLRMSIPAVNTPNINESIVTEIKHLKALKMLNLTITLNTLELVSELPVTTLFLRVPFSAHATIGNLDLTPLRRCLKLRILSLPAITSAQLEPLLTHPNARKVRNGDNKPYLICHVRDRPKSLRGSIRSVYNGLVKLEQVEVLPPVTIVEEEDDEMPPSNEEWNAQ